MAAVIHALLERDDASGLALDLVQGDTPVVEAVSRAIQKRESFEY